MGEGMFWVIGGEWWLVGVVIAFSITHKICIKLFIRTTYFKLFHVQYIETNIMICYNF